MELKKEFVKNCRKIGVLQEFLCQAIDQIDEKDTKIIQLEALIENYHRISKEIIDNANHQKRKRCLALSEKYGIAAQMQHDFTMRFDNPYYLKRAMFNEKWRDKWLSIANVFDKAQKCQRRHI